MNSICNPSQPDCHISIDPGGAPQRIWEPSIILHRGLFLQSDFSGSKFSGCFVRFGCPGLVVSMWMRLLAGNGGPWEVLQEEKKSYVYSSLRPRQKGKTWITAQLLAEHTILLPPNRGWTWTLHTYTRKRKKYGQNRKKYISTGNSKETQPVFGPQFIIAVKIQVCDLKYIILLS